MTEFSVDPATLQDLSTTLSGIHGQVQAMPGVATGFEGLVGGSDLEGEIGAFCSQWGFWITYLGDDLVAAVRHLNDACLSYCITEADNRNAAEPVAPPPVAPPQQPM